MRAGWLRVCLLVLSLALPCCAQRRSDVLVVGGLGISGEATFYKTCANLSTASVPVPVSAGNVRNRECVFFCYRYNLTFSHYLTEQVGVSRLCLLYL